MIDTGRDGSHSRRRRHPRETGPECRGIAGVAEPARGPGHGGFKRWLLDALVFGFAHGGCIHHTHPSYLDCLRDLSRARRRESIVQRRRYRFVAENPAKPEL